MKIFNGLKKILRGNISNMQDYVNPIVGKHLNTKETDLVK